MDPADVGGRRQTQAWLGPPMSPAPQRQRSLRWMPSPGELPSFPSSADPTSVGLRAVGMTVGGRYRLVRALGQGSVTETWEATHLELGRSVAIKFLRDAEPPMAERMLDEARTLARIRHPHVVEFFDFGRTEAGEPFLVMELLVGQTVEQLLARRGVIPWARSVAVIQQIAEALGAAHQQGVVHRDLRPGNVFLLETGQVGDFVKVVDFALARGAVAGTASYMSPEQARGEQLDPRSDVYALGCLLFAMVTGEPPFVGDAQRVIWQQINEAPKSLRERAPRQFIPDELEAIVTRCLAKLPAQRFADTRELAAELGQLVQAAASMVAGQIPDASASGSRPMGFAGRPPPKSPRELTNSFKPVDVPIVDNPTSAARPAEQPRPAQPQRTGMSAPAIVVATLASVVGVAGVGVGMYLLVNRLISEPADAGEARPAAVEVEPARAVDKREPVRAAAKPAAVTPAPVVADDPAPTPAEPAPPESASASADTESKPSAVTPASTTKPSKKSASKSSSREAEEPQPTPDPTPEPEPEPKPSKPSVDPDSKAKDKIGHDELHDPWG